MSYMRRLGALATLAPIVVSCAGPTSALDPASRAAERILDLWWFMFWTSWVVIVVVTVMTALAIWRRRTTTAPSDPVRVDPPRERRALWLIVLAGAVIPLVILGYLLVLTVRVGVELHPRMQPEALTIRVVGHKFWWEIHYPDHGVATANELHIPTGQPILLELESADVIHSFSAPRLQGRLDLVPGHTNLLPIETELAGIYRGLCAEFCGVQHALMQFLVVAEPPEMFEAWVAQQRQTAEPAVEPLVQEGQQIFERAGCALCHVVRGTFEAGAVGAVGPDLTHLASRRTIGAGILENNRENLAAWVLNPHDLKPGVRMPATDFDEDELAAILAYLESLE